MPCRLRITVYEARGLPVNPHPDSSGSFVEVKFAEYCEKTQFAKSLNPVWKEDFLFEITKDKIIQDDPVQLRVRWGDFVNDIIGVVYIDISSLLHSSGPPCISGWFPIYDTQRGIRGLLMSVIKLEFMDNINQFRDSSAGIKFFSVDEAISQHTIVKLFGVVSDIVIENNIPPLGKASNDQRQNILYHISGKLRRKIGLKVQGMGGNSVLGYKQQFEFDGGDNSSIIIAKGYGSASLIKKIRDKPKVENQINEPVLPALAAATIIKVTVFKNVNNSVVHVKEKCSNLTSTTSTPSSSNGGGGGNGGSGSGSGGSESIDQFDLQRVELCSKCCTISRAAQIYHHIAQLEFQYPDVPNIAILLLRSKEALIKQYTLYKEENFLLTASVFSRKPTPDSVHVSTLKTIPNFASIQYGALVMARSIKFLHGNDRIHRLSWWDVLRDELKSHARAINCDLILAYTESWSTFDDIAVLTVTGTACKIITNFNPNDNSTSTSTSTNNNNNGNVSSNAVNALTNLNNDDLKSSNETAPTSLTFSQISSSSSKKRKRQKKKNKYACWVLHIPYNNVNTSNASMCKCMRGKLPEIILSTTELPSNLHVKGEGKMIQVRISRSLKRQDGEQLISELISVIPQVEAELNTKLLATLKNAGYNCCFAISYQLVFRSNVIIYLATGSAYHLKHLNKAESDINQSINNDDCGDNRSKFDRTDVIIELSEANTACAYVKVPNDKLKAADKVVFPKNMTPFTTKLKNTIAKQTKTQMITIYTHLQWPNSKDPNKDLTDIFNYLFAKLVFQYIEYTSCTISQLTVDLLLDDNDLQLLLTGMVSLEVEQQQQGKEGASSSLSLSSTPPSTTPTSISPPSTPQNNNNVNDNNSQLSPSTPNLMTVMNEKGEDYIPVPPESPPLLDHFLKCQNKNHLFKFTEEITLSYSSYIPGHSIVKYVGRIDHHFIREDVGELEDICIREAFAITAAHAASLGANAVIGFDINTISFKRKANISSSVAADRSTYRMYGMVSVSGDAVCISPLIQ